MAWWLWILLGLGLLVFELATPGGLFALFFGCAALLVGLLAGPGIAGPAWAQWLEWAALSIAGVAVLRRPLLDRLGRRHPAPIDTLVGETAVPFQALPPAGVGQAELRGTTWQARNVGAEPLAAGQRCQVVQVEGLTLHLRPLD